MKAVWIYHQDGTNHGPFSEAELQRLFVDGAIGPDTYLWRRGLRDWVQYEVARQFFEETVVNGSAPPAPEARPPEQRGEGGAAQADEPDSGESAPVGRYRPRHIGCTFESKRRGGGSGDSSSFSRAYARAMHGEPEGEPVNASARGGLLARLGEKLHML